MHVSTRPNTTCGDCGAWEGCEACEAAAAAIERRAVVVWLRERAYQAAAHAFNRDEAGEPDAIAKGRAEARALRAAAEAIDAGAHR